jgi:antitoxin VapB
MSTPQLNIKDAETTAMVKELARLTGESQTEAVRKAVKERLEREQQQKRPDPEEIGRRMMALAEKISAKKKPGATSDHSFLYDENGLPI